MNTVVRCLLGLLNGPTNTADAAHTRRAVTVALRAGVGARADEPLQQQLVVVLLDVLRRKSFAPAVMCAAFGELTALVDELGPSASTHADAILAAAATHVDAARPLAPVTLSAALCVASVCRALPSLAATQLHAALDNNDFATVAAVAGVIDCGRLGAPRALIVGLAQRCVAELRARKLDDALAVHLFATLIHVLRLVPPDVLTQLLIPVWLNRLKFSAKLM